MILGIIVAYGVTMLGGNGGTEEAETHNDAGRGRDAGSTREGAIHIKDLGGANIPGGLGGADNIDVYTFDAENGRTIYFDISPGGAFAGQLSASLLPPDENSPVASTGGVGESDNFEHATEIPGTYALTVEGEDFEGSYMFGINLENSA